MIENSSEKKIPGQENINAIREGLKNVNRIAAQQPGAGMLVAALSQPLLDLEKRLTQLEQELTTRMSERGELAALYNISHAIGSSLDLAQVLNDGTVKWLSADYPIGEIMTLRGLFVFLPIAFFAWRGGGLRALEVRNLGAQGARAALTMLSTLFYLTALAVMPIADTIALTFTGPLFLTMLVSPLLGEPVGWRRWTAVVVGFMGVVVMVRPGSGT
ncbi:MAG: EamA family transporter, partial [Anaerolineae bacterium]